MDDIQKMIEESLKAEKIYQRLKLIESFSEVADIIDPLDEDMAKLVLRKFVYSRGQ